MTHFPFPGSSLHRVCFVLEPFAGHDAPRVHENNLVFDEIVEPSVSAHGYRLIRSSELCRPNYVTREHQRLAEEETLLVANLSYYDPVVFYGLAWRLARQPEMPVLLLLRHDYERLIETPVVSQPPVLYDLTAPRPTDTHYSEEEKADAIRRKLQLARRDLTRMVQHLGEKRLQSPPAAAPSLPAEPATVPGAQIDCAAVVDEIVRHLVDRAVNKRQGDITDGLLNTLVKPR
jgi:hypothetical protein